MHSGKDAARVPKGIHFLILSYNFVPKMVRTVSTMHGVRCRGRYQAAAARVPRLAAFTPSPPVFSHLPAGAGQAVQGGDLR